MDICAYANGKEPDQTVHLHSQVWLFTVCQHNIWIFIEGISEIGKIRAKLYGCRGWLGSLPFAYEKMLGFPHIGPHLKN